MSTENLKQCLECKKLKPASEFPPSFGTPDGLNDMCKACVKYFREHWKEDKVMVNWQKKLKKKKRRY